MTKESPSDVMHRFSSKGVFPHQMAFTLLIPFRNIFLSPRQLIDRLELKDDMILLEVGPGPGYFSCKIADQVKKGRLILADIQKEMLEYAKKRLQRKGIENVDFYQCDGHSFQFKEGTFDRIFMVTVIGEVENQVAYLKEFYRILKPGGMLSISELAGDPDKMTLEEVKELATKASFSFYRLYGNEKNYTINFSKEI